MSRNCLDWIDVTLVSVLTPSYNYVRFLPAAIQSVATTGGLQVEHIVSDGGSTDGTVDYLRALVPPVVWASEKDRGQSDALNRALSMASGEYIAWLNADDFYLPGALDKAVAFLEANPKYGAVQGDTLLVDQDGYVIRGLFGYPVPYSILASHGCVIASTSTVFRRSALGAEPWDVRLRYVMDWDLYLRLLEDGTGIAYLPELLAGMRIHEGQVSAAYRAGDGRGSEEQRMVRAKHQLGWRGNNVVRKLGSLGHFLAKRASAVRIGKHQVRDSGLRVLDDSGNVVPEVVEEVERRMYRRRRAR